MRYFDLTSWQGILSTILGLAVFTLIGVGIRVLMMLTIQQRQQRMNRQINERLRSLIAAYKTLGGSFTGELSVDPKHLRDLRASEPEAKEPSERPRRIRDAVEAALGHHPPRHRGTGAPRGSRRLRDGVRQGDPHGRPRRVP